jgi:hypothetical protein
MAALCKGTPARRLAESAHQSALARDIFGHPFQQTRPLRTWTGWNGGTVAKLAQAAYEHRELPAGLLNSTRLAILADALEEAGCDDQFVLGHLRSGGEHIRGCWAVDALLANP